jgi:hypothetical protein
MNHGMSGWRQRRRAARSRRALDQAMATANTPAMQQELLTLASSRQYMGLPR